MDEPTKYSGLKSLFSALKAVAYGIIVVVAPVATDELIRLLSDPLTVSALSAGLPPAYRVPVGLAAAAAVAALKNWAQNRKKV